ncbi:hypothetical protein P691DRAFT_801040 [Macrolepiota fuliginosa MF-IS2]|uniref:Hydrophobin n=1 Tax=Macrolepiota fuliginosa MF-IS2 TaxID=1400762 RepID=A0A9P5XCP3_9AGAR|nr:hypothetical protein P691DRAFT_801040 [Macrolepiota fuliginosa MF-IS2]
MRVITSALFFVLPALSRATLNQRQICLPPSTALCCVSINPPDTSAVLAVLALVGLPAIPIPGGVGLTCSSPGLLGICPAGTTRTCCLLNDLDGIIAFGCT